MVGIDSKKLNSSAVGRSIPTNCPAAMVDMERDVPGKMAESDWHKPIQMAWPMPISSTCTVCGSYRHDHVSTTHIITPPSSNAIAITVRLLRFLSLHFFSRSAGIDVQRKAIIVSEMG